MTEQQELVPIEKDVEIISSSDIEQQQAIIPVSGIDVGKLDGMLEKIDDVVDKINELFLRVLRRTQPGHWVNIDGTPYLTTEGALAALGILAKLGFQIEIKPIGKPEKIWSEDEQGRRYYIWQYFGMAIVERASFTVTGICSSRDSFFGKAHGQMKELRDIDETDIMKKAYSQLVRIAIVRICGFNNLSWEDIERTTEGKIGRKNVEGYEFKKGEKPSQGKPTSKYPTPKQRGSIYRYFKEEFKLTDKEAKALGWYLIIEQKNDKDAFSSLIGTLVAVSNIDLSKEEREQAKEDKDTYVKTHKAMIDNLLNDKFFEEANLNKYSNKIKEFQERNNIS